VKPLPRFNIPEAWIRHPFRAEPPVWATIGNTAPSPSGFRGILQQQCLRIALLIQRLNNWFCVSYRLICLISFGFLFTDNYYEEFLVPLSSLGRTIPGHNPQFTWRYHKSTHHLKLIALEIKFVLTVVYFCGFNFFPIWSFTIRHEERIPKLKNWLTVGFFQSRFFHLS